MTMKNRDVILQAANPQPTLDGLLGIIEEDQHEVRTYLVEAFRKITGREWSETEHTKDGSNLLSHAEWLRKQEYDLRLLATALFESL